MDLYTITNPNQISVYSTEAGDGQPLRTIRNPRTDFWPEGIALDNSRNLYFTSRDSRNLSIFVYPADADGDVQPARAINRWGLLACDGADNLYVYNNTPQPAVLPGSVQVFAPDASGNAGPIAELFVPNGNIGDIAIDSRDHIYVSTSVPAAITVYPPGAEGHAQPVRRIAGPATRLVAPRELDFDGDDNLYVANIQNAAVFEAHVANGDVSPIRSIEGGNARIPNVMQIAADTDGLMYAGTVGDEFEDPRLSVFAADASGDVSPIRVITGVPGSIPGAMAIGKPSRIQFVHWTSANTDGALGTLHGGPVTLSGPMGTAFYLHDDYPHFARATFTPTRAATGMVEVVGGLGHSFTLSFGAVLQDPIFHLGSLASVLTFPPGTAVTRLSGDSGFVVAGNVVAGNPATPIHEPDGTLGPSDSNGSVRLTGAFSTITFTLVPNFADGRIADGVFLQVGAARPGGG